MPEMDFSSMTVSDLEYMFTSMAQNERMRETDDPRWLINATKFRIYISGSQISCKLETSGQIEDLDPNVDNRIWRRNFIQMTKTLLPELLKERVMQMKDAIITPFIASALRGALV